MEIQVILSIVVLGVMVVIVTPANAAPRHAVGCLRYFPQSFEKALDKCKLNVEETMKKTKQAATDVTPSPAPISAADRTAIECVIHELKLDTDGLYNQLRRVLDGRNNYPIGRNQVIFWKKLKQVAAEVTNNRRPVDEIIPLFIDGIYAEYDKLCE